MKFTLSWLKSHLATDASVDQIADTLTDIGLEIEEVIDPSARLAAFTIGYVKSSAKHPEADKLRICEVVTDEGSTQIICGAPNAREGIYVVVAKPGTYVPGIDTTIGVGKIRGVESFGMMCSERELELSDEHDGIIELENEAEIGARFLTYLEKHAPHQIDPVFEIAITPNRGDALGVRGIARDLAARGLGKLREQKDEPLKGAFPCPIKVQIASDTKAQAPIFYGRLIRGVKNGPSPEWLRRQLKAIGLRPINFLVDVTNFFTYDQNRPLHVFDAGKIKGDTLTIHRSQGQEAFIGLDESTYGLAPGLTAISDETGVISLGGIMGGLSTGCSEETRDVFLEAAYFDPVSTALTGRALKIHSDASYRFERGIDPQFTPIGLDRATEMILEYAGGEASEAVCAGAMPDTTRQYSFDPKRIESLVGMTLPRARQEEILTDLGFEVKGEAVEVPSWRSDVMDEADLVEEVARIASLSKLIGRPLPRLHEGVARPVLTSLQKRDAMARRFLAARGYNECITYSFIDQKSAAHFGGGMENTALSNPISRDMSHMRPSLFPGLMMAAARNQARGFMDLALFEVGPVFHGSASEDQELLACGILVGQSAPREAFETRRAVDVFDAKADASALLSMLGAPENLMVMRGAKSWWHPGRSGKLTLGPKNTLAAFGEIHPKIIKAMQIKGPVMGFALHLEKLPTPKSKSMTRPALRVSDFQAVERDFAFIVDEKCESINLVKAVQAADKTLIESVRIFDVFEGEPAYAQLGPGNKSIGVTVRIEPQEKTLTDEDIEAISQKITENVLRKCEGRLRTS